MRLIDADKAIKCICDTQKDGRIEVSRVVDLLELLATSSFFDKKLEEEKLSPWTEHDKGFNEGLDKAISILCR